MSDKKTSQVNKTDFENTIFQNLPDARDNRINWAMVTAAVLLGKASSRGKR